MPAPVTYALGIPRPATARGGDCRAYDVNRALDVHGPHFFAAPAHVRITNGLIRLTASAAGTTPTLTVEGFRPAVTIGDYYTDIYTDIYPGTLSTPAWLPMGSLVIDSATVAALLTTALLVHVNPEVVTVRLVSPAIGDAFVSLRRGRRHVDIMHGNTRAPVVTTDRRLRWTDSPSPVGTATAARVEETNPRVEGFPRFVASLDAVTTSAAAFSVTAAATTTSRFIAGIGIDAAYDRPADHHAQAADASRPHLVLT